MQSIWWLYLLVFAFGYLTCKTFYFFSSVRLSLVLLKLSHSLSLYIIVRGVESLEYAKNVRVIEMKEIGESDRNIEAFVLNFEHEVKLYKDKAIREIVTMHPKIFQDVIDYDDWPSAMLFLNSEGREYIRKFTQDV